MTFAVTRPLPALAALGALALLPAGCAHPPLHHENIVIPHPAAAALTSLLQAHPGWRLGRREDVTEPGAKAYMAGHPAYHPFITHRDLTGEGTPDLVVALRDSTRPDGHYSLFAFVGTSAGYGPPQVLLTDLPGPAMLLPGGMRIAFGAWGADMSARTFWWDDRIREFSDFEPASVQAERSAAAPARVQPSN